MGFISELKKIGTKHQSNSKAGKEDKLKSDGVGPSISSDLNYRSQQVADRKSHNHGSVKRNTGKRDEPVKHMTNLPGYLFRTDREENIRGKALNVGVLDWARLEKWRHKQMSIPTFGANFTSFGVRESPSRMVPQSFASSCRRDKHVNQRGFVCSNIKASYKESFPDNSNLSFQNAIQSYHSKFEADGIMDEHRNVTLSKLESSSRSHMEISFEKAKRKFSDKINLEMENIASNLQHQGISQVSDRNINGGDGKNLEAFQDYGIRKKDKIRERASSMGLSSCKPKGEGVPFHLKQKTSVYDGQVKKSVEKSLESDIKPSDIGQKPCSNKPRNILPLHPQEIPQSSCQQVHQSRMPFDANVSESSHGRLSNVANIDEVYSEYGNHEILHSCPLPCVVEPAPTTKLMQRRSNVDQDNCYSTIASKKMYSSQFEGAYDEKNALDDNLKSRCVYYNSNKSGDQERAEQRAQRGRNPSPNRRFSFNLGRIGRSFSFKEGSSLSQVSSTYVSVKSGPMTSESSDCLDTSRKEKVGSHRRTGSSPFRRILDPILKYKATEIRHPKESSQQETKVTIDPINFVTNSVKESISHAEKSQGSSIHALLHLTIKNGVPIFKFVLNNERKILAATIKKLASPEKDDSDCFTFYLVDEVKKKNGGYWMSHRSKDKCNRYVYNVVGQMKSSSSKTSKASNKNSKTQCFTKEFVLLSVEIGQKDQITPKFIPSQELAAVLVEIPYGNGSQGADNDMNFLKNECLKCLAEDRCSCSSSRENDVSSKTTVILPGGIHGSPSKGEPSPLIYRWKTGGLCDCGGWDIGCKLLVLSNHKERSITTTSSISHQRPFQLFIQEGVEQNRPLFTLMPLKDGFFSVEFSSLITHLQAFFISVSLLNCQKEIALEMNKIHEASKGIGSKKNDGLQGKEPIKYTPIPPLSPVGRV